MGDTNFRVHRLNETIIMSHVPMFSSLNEMKMTSMIILSVSPNFNEVNKTDDWNSG